MYINEVVRVGCILIIWVSYMKSQVLHTVWCNISGEAAGEIWNWSYLGVKGLTRSTTECTKTDLTRKQSFGNRRWGMWTWLWQWKRVFIWNQKILTLPHTKKGKDALNLQTEGTHKTFKLNLLKWFLTWICCTSPHSMANWTFYLWNRACAFHFYWLGMWACSLFQALRWWKGRK